MKNRLLEEEKSWILFTNGGKWRYIEREMCRFCYQWLQIWMNVWWRRVESGFFFSQFHEDYPEMFHLLYVHQYWSFNETVDVSILIDAYMYSIFLGCMKAIASIIKSCMKDKHKTQIFLCVLNTKLKALNNHHSQNVPSNKNVVQVIPIPNHIA